ncbi:unnamed protein product [[Candida] boidinii]|nr:DNA binding protein [[Candida] boidinii]OWB83207.1 DNA binding protein [[Candida] boidinii]GMF55037.1 unnamed protein product [[Candida] boidinii]
MSNQQYNYSTNNGYSQVPGAPQRNRVYDYSQYQYQAQPQYQQPQQTVQSQPQIQQQVQSQATYPQLQKQISSTGALGAPTPGSISQQPGYSVAAGSTGYMIGQQQHQQQQLAQDYGYGIYGYTNSAAQYNQYQTSQPQIAAGRLQVTPSYGPSPTAYSPATQDTKPAVATAPTTSSAKNYNSATALSVADSIGQVQPANSRPKVTTTMWEDEKTLCYQVEANGVSVVRRSDNNMINGTKLLNVARMTRGRRDGILKSEKTRHVVKIGSMHLKGVWIPFDRALFMAQREGIVDILYPLFVKDIKRVIQKGAPPSSSTSVAVTKSSETDSAQPSAVSSTHSAPGTDYASSLNTATTVPGSSSSIADKVLPAVGGTNTTAVARTYPSGLYSSSTGSVGNASQYGSYYQASSDQQSHQQPYYYNYNNYQQTGPPRQGQQISPPQIHNPQQTSQQR